MQKNGGAFQGPGCQTRFVLLIRRLRPMGAGFILVSIFVKGQKYSRRGRSICVNMYFEFQKFTRSFFVEYISPPPPSLASFFHPRAYRSSWEIAVTAFSPCKMQCQKERCEHLSRVSSSVSEEENGTKNLGSAANRRPWRPIRAQPVPSSPGPKWADLAEWAVGRRQKGVLKKC